MDMTLTLGEIVVASTIVFTAGGFYAVSRRDGKRMEGDITDIKSDIKKLNEVVVTVALQNQRLDSQADRATQFEKRTDERFAALERRWDEVRRGEGLITERPRAGV